MTQPSFDYCPLCGGDNVGKLRGNKTICGTGHRLPADMAIADPTESVVARIEPFAAVAGQLWETIRDEHEIHIRVMAGDVRRLAALYTRLTEGRL